MCNRLIQAILPFIGFLCLPGFALSPQLQYMLLLGEGATLNGKGV